MVYIGIALLTLCIFSSSAFQLCTPFTCWANNNRPKGSELRSSPDNVMDALDLALAQMSQASNKRPEGTSEKQTAAPTATKPLASMKVQTKAGNKPTKDQLGPVQFPFTDTLFKSLAADAPTKAVASSTVTTPSQSTTAAATKSTTASRRFSEEDAVMAAYGKALNGATENDSDKTSGNTSAYRVSVSAPQKAMEGASSRTSSMPSKYTAVQGFATLQSTIVGAISGVIAIAPFTSLHHFYFYPYPDYTGLAQWEWDTVTAAIQGAVYGAVYRYSLREDVDEDKIRDGVFTAFVLVRTLVRLQVPSYCAALPLQCGEPLEYLDWSMIGQLAMSYVESVALFGVVGAMMDFLLREKIIKPFPNE